MARRPSRGLPTRRQGKLTMRAAKMGKKKRGKAAGKKVVKRAAKRSKSTAGYTPPRVATAQPSAAPAGPFNRFGMAGGGAMMRGLLAARRR